MPTRTPPPRTGLLVLVGLLFALVAGFAAVTDPAVVDVPVPQIELERTPEGDEPTWSPEVGDVDYEPQRSSELVSLLGVLLLVLLIGGLVALLASLWRHRRISLRPLAEAREDPVTAGSDTAEVKAAVEAGLEELAVSGTDPRAAVIACWLRLERAAAAAGTRREVSDTAGDLVARMLAAHEVSAPVLDRLAAVYRLARYAPHDVGEAMRDEAQAALRQLHTELSHGSRATPTPAEPA